MQTAAPARDSLPDKGILQFYIHDGESSVHGLTSDNLCSQELFRVIYHESIEYDRSKLMTEEEMPKTLMEDFPIKGEFILEPHEITVSTVTASDYRFERLFIESFNRLTGKSAESIEELESFEFEDNCTIEEMYDFVENFNTCLMGYPSFTQNDPREDERYRNYSVMLFQSDSKYSDDRADYEISWGDVGIANFFITPEDLARRDFSNVLYTWDCG